MEKTAKIYVAGGETALGKSLLNRLAQAGYKHIVGSGGGEPSLDNASYVEAFFAETNPQYVFLVAGKSGGIAMNQHRPAELMIDNLLVECNVIDAAYRHKVTKLLYLASSCVYPRDCPQPIGEDSLLNGPLEPTNQAYAVAKIAGIELCRAYNQQYGANFITGVPANVFGPGDDFSLEDSHVIAALIRKIHDTKEVNGPTVGVWGSGAPRREFIFVDDLADACVYLMDHYDAPEPINIAGGAVVSIRELAELIKEIIGYSGALEFDGSKPDGMPIKALDSSRIKTMGWEPETSLRSGLVATYGWFSDMRKANAVIHGV